LAKHHDLIRIAAEVGDVDANPFQGFADIQDAKVLVW
jgi:hypothetical protein